MIDNKQSTITPASTSPQDIAAEIQARLSLNRIGQVPVRRSHHKPSGQTHRHRFVRDGEVPTVYTRRIPEQLQAAGEVSEELAALQAELARERAARAETNAALEDAKATTRSLQTRLGHKELELREMRERAAPVPVAVAEKKAAPVRAARVSKPKVKRVEKEPQPVKWWIKK